MRGLVEVDWRGWVVIGVRVAAAGAATFALVAAGLSLLLSGCHDSGGFCAGEKTTSDAWEAAGSAGISLAVAAGFGMIAIALPRRHWLKVALVTAVIATAAGTFAYFA